MNLSLKSLLMVFNCPLFQALLFLPIEDHIFSGDTYWWECTTALLVCCCRYKTGNVSQRLFTRWLQWDVETRRPWTYTSVSICMWLAASYPRLLRPFCEVLDCVDVCKAVVAWILLSFYQVKSGQIKK